MIDRLFGYFVVFAGIVEIVFGGFLVAVVVPMAASESGLVFGVMVGILAFVAFLAGLFLIVLAFLPNA